MISIFQRFVEGLSKVYDFTKATFRRGHSYLKVRDDLFISCIVYAILIEHNFTPLLNDCTTSFPPPCLERLKNFWRYAKCSRAAGPAVSLGAPFCAFLFALLGRLISIQKSLVHCRLHVHNFNVERRFERCSYCVRACFAGFSIKYKYFKRCLRVSIETDNTDNCNPCSI